MAQIKSADAVVVGGGARGCSIALFLARAGVRVALLERRFISAMVSSANGAQVNVSCKLPEHYTAMSLRSARMYPEFLDSLDSDIFLQQEGILFAALEPEEMAEWRQRVEAVNRVPGVDAQLLDGPEAREIVPALSSDVIGGYITKADGIVDVLKLVPAMARAAVRAGAEILRGVEVTGIKVQSGRVAGVSTTQGEIATPVIVNAAGVHVPHIGRMVGINIPVDAEHGHIVISPPYAPLIPIPTEYVTQWPNGSFGIGTTNQNIGIDTRVRAGWLPPFVHHALRLLPGLKNVNALRVFAQLRPMPPDRRPIYDRAPGIDGFYIAVGHSGITLAPLTGKIFADLIVHGDTDIDLTPYRLKRFSDPAGS